MNIHVLKVPKNIDENDPQFTHMLLDKCPVEHNKLNH